MLETESNFPALARIAADPWVRPPSMSNISADQIFAWIERYAAHIAEQKDYLTQLDAAIGDADHGANMNRGFQAVLAKKADLHKPISVRFSKGSR